jgi:C1A family cysteine protease
MQIKYDRLGFQVKITAFACALCLIVASPLPSAAQPLEETSSNGLKAAPLNPEFIKYMAERNSEARSHADSNGRSYGHIPPSIEIPPPAEPVVSPLQAAALPAKFDLRKSSPVGVTSVKNQFKCDCCWAFATMASLESHIRYKMGINVDLSAADLNENNGCYPGVCQGGNWQIATGYLARWGGPLTERNAPFPYFFNEESPPLAADPGSLDSVEFPSAALQESTATPGVPTAYHVQNVYFLPQADRPLTTGDIASLKQAIIDNGAVVVAFFWSDDYYSEENHSFYCDDGNRDKNHEVVIVGWDDTYPKSNFKTPAPGNGAFIAKNSWGINWGERGYFYMSYYDKSLVLGAQFYNVESVINYTRIYQYDPYGWTNSYGNGDTGWFANIFMASANASTIKAVSFYTPVPNSTYAVWVYSNVTPGQPRSGTQVGTTKSGAIVKPGYNTVHLAPATVAANKPFSVVVRLTTPGYNSPIPAQSAAGSFAPVASSCYGQSFTSSDGGTTWYSTGGAYNVCLKALAIKQAQPWWTP